MAVYFLKQMTQVKRETGIKTIWVFTQMIMVARSIGKMKTVKNARPNEALLKPILNIFRRAKRSL